MKYISTFFLLLSSFFAAADIKLEHQSINNNYKIESTSTWLAFTKKDVFNVEGNAYGKDAFFASSSLYSLAENNIKVEYQCITPLPEPGETRKHIEQFSIRPSLSSYKSPLSNMVHFKNYKVIFDNGAYTLNIDGVYLAESNNSGSLGFKVTETPSIKRIIENGGNVSISFNGTKIIINFDGYKEGYYLMNECLTNKIKN